MTDSSDESPLKFPCEFPVKVMGKTGENFEVYVIEIFRRHVPDLDEGLITQRESQGGKYISVTVTIQAQSRKQLDAIYQELSDSKQVLMAL
jgi:putative lipoic acid-binding regulatory protein